MAAMDDLDGKAAEHCHGGGVISAIGVIGIIDQRAVIDDVAGEEDAGPCLEERDAARRVSRGVDDLEGAVSEIDQIAMAEKARRRCRCDAIGGSVPAARRGNEHLIGGVAIGERPVAARIGEDRRLGGFDTAVVAFVMTADVVEMGMARDTDDRATGHQRDVAPQADVAEAGVEQEVAVAAAHMPHVAAVEGLDPWLVDERDIVAHADGLVPVAGIDKVGRSHFHLVVTITFSGSQDMASRMPTAIGRPGGTLASNRTAGSRSDTAVTLRKLPWNTTSETSASPRWRALRGSPRSRCSGRSDRRIG